MTIRCIHNKRHSRELLDGDIVEQSFSADVMGCSHITARGPRGKVVKSRLLEGGWLRPELGHESASVGAPLRVPKHGGVFSRRPVPALLAASYRRPRLPPRLYSPLLCRPRRPPQQ